jgi:hypothetical protein
MPPHVLPLATHTRPLPQQAVPEQVPPAQHGSPAPPHAAQTPPRQEVLEAVQVLPEQQGPPAAPQVPHLPPEHMPPPTAALHVVPELTHVPFTQHPLPPPHELLSQQICPGPPQATPVFVVDPDPQPIHRATDNKAMKARLNDLIGCLYRTHIGVCHQNRVSGDAGHKHVRIVTDGNANVRAGHAERTTDHHHGRAGDGRDGGLQ